MIVTVDYDNIPENEKAGKFITGWYPPRVDGEDTIRTNVIVRVNGVKVPLWPVRNGEGWLPEYVTVTG